jgi:hypothetical protein
MNLSIISAEKTRTESCSPERGMRTSQKKTSWLNNKLLISDFISMTVITLGVVLLVGGLYLMATDSGNLSRNEANQLLPQSPASIIGTVPGIPFDINSLSTNSSSSVGFTSWVVGLDFLLIGLGLWVRHR